MELDEAVVVITGACGGIGRAFAAAFADAGSKVIGVDLPGTGADVEIDVTDAAGMNALIVALDRVDVVIANAGVAVCGLLEEIPRTDWTRTLDVNISGALNLVLPAYARLRQQRSGAIVLVSSLAGLAGTPLLTPYAMTKSALIGLGASLRSEAARHGVGVTVVCPGPVETSLLDSAAITRGVDVRRYLCATAGKPISPADLAARTVGAVRRDRAMVVPKRAGIIWRLNRLFPELVAGEIGRSLKRELRHAGVPRVAPMAAGSTVTQ